METPSHKIVVVGNGGAGKTSMMKRWLGEDFNNSEQQTLGVEMKKMRVTTTAGEQIIDLWDCGDATWGITEAYYLSAAAALFVFSVTDRESFNALPIHARNVWRVTGDIPHVVVGNKCDLERERLVQPAAGEGEILFQEISCAAAALDFTPLRDILRRLTGEEDLEIEGLAVIE